MLFLCCRFYDARSITPETEVQTIRWELAAERTEVCLQGWRRSPWTRSGCRRVQHRPSATTSPHRNRLTALAIVQMVHRPEHPFLRLNTMLTFEQAHIIFIQPLQLEPMASATAWRPPPRPSVPIFDGRRPLGGEPRPCPMDQRPGFSRKIISIRDLCQGMQSSLR